MIQMKEMRVPDDLLRALLFQTRHLRFTLPKTIYYCVDVDYRNVYAGVMGDGSNATYEWFVWDAESKVLKTSDCGYSCTGVALCCGLVEAGAERSNGDHDLKLGWSRA